MKLEIGSGRNPRPGYVHCDIRPDLPCLEYCCAADNLTVESGSMEEVLAINVLEHIEWTNIKHTLSEWVRVLKVGGRVLIHVPDISYIPKILGTEEWRVNVGVQPFNAGTDRWEYLNHYVMSTNCPYNMHRSVFDYPTLTNILGELGMGGFNRLPTDPRWLYLMGMKER